ncbi:MAG: hypothetical protein H7096_01270 [Flavobacterium sp.]|nr:hypothetical protein [Pedobacter sp.]
MKYEHVYALFLMVIFCTSCGQNQKNVAKDNTQSKTKDTATPCGPNSMVRNVKQARNGDILIASYTQVFRYDARLPARAGSDGNDKVGQGKLFTNITST